MDNHLAAWESIEKALRGLAFGLWVLGKLALWLVVFVAKAAVYIWMGLFMLITGGFALVCAFFLTVIVLAMASNVILIMCH